MSDDRKWLLVDKEAAYYGSIELAENAQDSERDGDALEAKRCREWSAALRPQPDGDAIEYPNEDDWIAAHRSKTCGRAPFICPVCYGIREGQAERDALRAALREMMRLYESQWSDEPPALVKAREVLGNG